MTLPVMQAVPRSVTRPVTHAFSQSVTHVAVRVYRNKSIGSLGFLWVLRCVSNREGAHNTPETRPAVRGNYIRGASRTRKNKYYMFGVLCTGGSAAIRTPQGRRCGRRAGGPEGPSGTLSAPPASAAPPCTCVRPAPARPASGRCRLPTAPARCSPDERRIVATQRHGHGAPGPSFSSWCSHRAHPSNRGGSPDAPPPSTRKLPRAGRGSAARARARGDARCDARSVQRTGASSALRFPRTPRRPRLCSMSESEVRCVSTTSPIIAKRVDR
eukprot:1178520-Prorocentrum_minimum.AAC.2